MHSSIGSRVVGWVLAGLVVAALDLPARANLPPVGAHPRVWLTPARLTRLQGWAAQNTSRWKRVKQLADAAFQKSSVCSQDEQMDLAIVSVVQANASYCTRAVADLILTLPTLSTSHDSSYDYRSFGPPLAFVHDACYAQETPAQRGQIAKWMMDAADYVWPETNPARVGAWAVADPPDNYFSGFMMTGPMSLACDAADDTGTPAAYCANKGQNRVDCHRALIYDTADPKSKWSMMLAFLNGWGVGGVFSESTNYDSTQRVSLVADAYGTATGGDLINIGTSFFKDSLYWRIYSTVPQKDLYYPLGDQPRVSIGPLSDYDRMRAFIPRLTVKDTQAAAYAQYWLDDIGAQPQWSFQAPWEFLFYEEGASKADYTQTLPTAYFASGPGVFLKRANWSQTATYFGIWAGPLKEGHQNADVNGFLVYKGGWLVGNTTIWSQSGIVNDGMGQNNITIEGKTFPNIPAAYGPPYEQSWQDPDTKWPDEAGKTLREVDDVAGGFTYFAGQGKQAYVQDRSHDGVALLSDYVRKLVYLTAIDSFLVYDRVTALDAAVTKVWHLHSQKAIAVNGRAYVFDNGSSQLNGQSLLPGAGVSVAAIAENQGPGNAVSSYQLNEATSNGVATDFLLNVMQIGPIGQAVPAPQAIQATSGNMEGAEVGTWVALMGKTEAVSGSIDYQLPTPGKCNHLLTDLTAWTDYAVTAKDGSGSVLWTSHATADGSGCLRFDGQGTTEAHFTLAPGAANPPDGGTQGCIAPQILCGTSCTNPLTDHENCGTCGHACSVSEYCANGSCSPYMMNSDATYPGLPDGGWTGGCNGDAYPGADAGEPVFGADGGRETSVKSGCGCSPAAGALEAWLAVGVLVALVSSRRRVGSRRA